MLAKLNEQSEMLEGKNGALMWAVSAVDGRNLAEYKLKSLPAWDGMVVAGRRLYLTTVNGEVASFSGKGD